MVKLKDLIKTLEVESCSGGPDTEITDVTYDSRTVRPGSLFAAVRGLSDDGRRYIRAAVRAGASAVMVDADLIEDPGVPVIRVSDSRRSMALAASELYGRPTEKMVLIGITGTKGKTTTAFLLESILKQAGLTTGLMGTIKIRYPGVDRPAVITTPEGPDLQRDLAGMVEAGVTHVVFEVSSHALDLSRVAGCRFDVGVYTNLGHDHLDYHRDLDSYFGTKKRLFTEYLTGSHLPGGPQAVINADDAWGRKLIAELGPRALTFGLNRPADLRAVEIDAAKSRRTGLAARIFTTAGNLEVHTRLLGNFNLSNFMAAVGAALALGLDLKHIAAGLEAATVPGRLERVGGNEDYLVLVDYAHTAEAMTSSLTSVRDLEPKRLITVFGCGGDRDRTKRPLMGGAAGKLSDLAIITNDNPRTEDPLSIIREIEPGVKALNLRRLDSEKFNGTPSYAVVPDRREAIRLGVRLMSPGDILVVTGKGHEDYQVIGKDKIHFDDREEVLKALESEGKS